MRIWSLYDTKASICSRNEESEKTGEVAPGGVGTNTKMVNLATNSATNRESKISNLDTER